MTRESAVDTPIIRHLVHQAVLHSRRCLVINAVLTLRGEVPRFLDFIRPNTLRNAYHPQELIDVVTRITNQTAKDNQNIVDVMFA
jgi:hypothetical protein